MISISTFDKFYNVSLPKFEYKPDRVFWNSLEGILLRTLAGTRRDSNLSSNFYSRLSQKHYRNMNIDV
jgi:hypothetical protein